MELGIQVALIMAGASIGTGIVPIVIDRIRARDRRKDRREDRERQDEVARRVSDTTRQAADAAASAATTAQKTLEVAKNNQQLAITTHALVNSDMTKVKAALLAALELAIEVMNGMPLSSAKLEETHQQILDLKEELQTRNDKHAQIADFERGLTC
jgi:hypothetical protein